MKLICSSSVFFLTLTAIVQAQTAPTGNDSQGGVSAPPGKYEGIPAAGLVLANPYTANGPRVVHDLSVASVGEVGLAWTRTGSSRIPNGSQWMGSTWRDSYQWEFATTTVNSVPALIVVYPDSTTNYFTQTSPGVWTSTSAVTDVITPNGTGYLLTNSANQVYSFAEIGTTQSYELNTITDSKGLVTTLSYNGSNVLSKVTEPGGRYLTIGYTSLKISYFIPQGNNSIPASSSDSSGSTSLAASPQTSGTYTYQNFVSSVTSSDGRSVSYNYATITSTFVNQTWYYNYVSKATYSDASTATYTGILKGVNVLLTQAQDTRAEGVPSITTSYFNGGSDPVGALQTVQEATSNSTISTLSLSGGSAQTPKIAYPDGNVYTFNVSTGGLMSSVSNLISSSNSYAYNSGSGTYTTTITDSNGNSVAKTRTSRGKITSRVWPKTAGDVANPTESWTYNSANYLSSYTDTLGHTTNFTRAPGTNLLTSISYPDGTSESFTYNSFKEVLTHTRRNGGIEYFTYDTTGLLQSEKDAVGNVTSYTRDANNRVASITDANSNTTSFLYNDRGQRTKVTHPDATYQSFTYDSAGDVLTKTDELGHVWTNTYNGFHRVLTAKDPLGHITTYSYNALTPGNNNPITITAPSGKQTKYVYNWLWGYATSSVTSANGTSDATTVNYYYDNAGNLSQVTDGRGKITSYTYDQRERKDSAQDAVGNVTDYDYDDASNVTSVVTPAGSTSTVYDAMNRPKQVTDPRGQVVQYTYDSEGQVKTQIDPTGNAYTYSYDLDERKTALQYPDHSSEGYAYDPVGAQHTYTTRDSKVQTYSYDSRNRCNGYTWNDGSTPAVTEAYDSASRITSLSNANSALSYTYDNANNQLTETQNVNGLGSKTVTYGYNQDNVLTALTYPDATSLAYSYNNRNQVTAIQQGGTTVAGYSYDLDGNRTGRTSGDGVASTLTYDSDDRLTSIADSASSTSLERFDYGYDAMNRRTYVKRDSALGDVYGYDTSNQVTSVAYNATNPDTTPINPSRTVAYTFDAAGNRTKVVDSVNGTVTATPNADSEYSVWAGLAVSYDGRGNMTTFNESTLGYDAQNRLLSGTSGTNSLACAYDPLGRCVKRTQNGTVTYEIYDVTWNVLADFNSAGTQTARYVHGAAIDEIVSRTDNTGTVVYYHTDGLGNVSKLTSPAGTVLEQYTYDIYGAVTIKNAVGTVLTASAYANRFLFTGREFLSSLGLYDNRARMYFPVLGRFLQTDPLRFSAGDSNIYRYCDNNPIDYADPSGQFVQVVVGAVVAAAFDVGLQYVRNGYSFNNFRFGEFLIVTGAGALTGGISVFASSVVAAGAGTAGTAFLTTVGINAAGNSLVDGIEDVSLNLINGNSWDQNLGDSLLAGFGLGAIGAGVGGLILTVDQSITAANAPLLTMLNENSSVFSADIGTAYGAFISEVSSNGISDLSDLSTPPSVSDTQTIQNIFDVAFPPSGDSDSQGLNLTSSPKPVVYQAAPGFDPSQVNLQNPGGTVIQAEDGQIILNPDGSVNRVIYQ